MCRENPTPFDVDSRDCRADERNVSARRRCYARSFVDPFLIGVSTSGMAWTDCSGPAARFARQRCESIRRAFQAQHSDTIGARSVLSTSQEVTMRAVVGSGLWRKFLRCRGSGNFFLDAFRSRGSIMQRGKPTKVPHRWQIVESSQILRNRPPPKNAIGVLIL